MICPEMEMRLNEYVDGTLAAPERAAVEAHLAGCAGCRAAVPELRRLVAGARDLPRSIEPRRDLWLGIAARIGPRAMWNVRRRFWRLAFAAAAMLALGVGLYRLLPPSTALYHPAGKGWAAVQADYEHATDELSGLFAEQRGRLQPGTVALVERNLGVIDGAIRESRAALARDPANAELQSLFAAAARQKVELLRWAARVAAT
jgi:hypothetical protein